MNKNEILEKCEYYQEQFKAYSYILQTFSYDRSTIAPMSSSKEASDAEAIVESHIFELTHTDEYKAYVLEAFKKKDQFDKYHKRLFELQYKEMVENDSISKELSEKLNKTLSECFSDWMKYKEKKDYKLVEPSFKKTVDVLREYVKAKNPNAKHPYDVLLNDNEPGETEEVLDEFFNKLKERIIPLLKKIQASNNQPDSRFFNRMISDKKQVKIALSLLKFNGFRIEDGVYGTIEHPCTYFLSEHDTRVTTHYREDWSSSIYSIIHEGGHGIYHQNLDKKCYEVGINERQSSAEQETISRFYENIIGRNKTYVSHLYKLVKKCFGSKVSDISEEDLYKAANKVQASLIRTESDELTYSIHILIRYELEKGLIDGYIETKDLNKKWNELYKEYLGVEPNDDEEGILQDMHWFGGLFGYFPSYALGNAYGAQILSQMKKEIDYDSILEKGQMKKILLWFKKRVFTSGTLLDPEDWIKSITGERLNADYFLDYLEDKYTRIYNI